MKRSRTSLLCALLLLTALLSSCFGPGKDLPSARLPFLSPDTSPLPSLDTLPYSAYEEAEAIAEEFTVDGNISSATAAGFDLRIAWTLYKESGKKDAVLNMSFLIDFEDGIDFPEDKEMTIVVDGERETLPVPATVQEGDGFITMVLNQKTSFPFPESRGKVVTVEASLDYDGVRRTTDHYGNPIDVRLDTVSVRALIPITDEYRTLPSSAKLDVKNVMQTPELPNGCEITSLTILLNYLGFDVDKLTMADEYLPKNEDTYTSDFRQTFSGNPRNQKRSFGCYAPVIVQSALNFLSDRENGKDYTPRDLSGVCPEELYRQIALGNPVVVWMTQYIDSTPHILKTWESAEGKAMNWKHPLHCVVLTGYDKEAGTITICDPLVGVVTHPMEKFELRYRQLGSQAVVVTKN